MRPVIIAGPSASGKSALALAIAERDGGWVINADALQVYACWRVLTARPSDSELARAPHRLYGHVDCRARHSVGAWLREIAGVLQNARACGARPVIVGGTGLYLSALTSGLAEIPPIPAEVRARSTALLRTGGLEPFLADLQRDDPATLARIDRSNPIRVQRAWEVRRATGRGLAAWQDAPASPVLPAEDAILVMLMPETAQLNILITQRFYRMLQDGALQECDRSRKLEPRADMPAARALGAAELIAHLEGRLTLEAAAEAAVAATRRYAKRQRTWFRNQMADWAKLDPEGALERIPRG